MREMIKRTKFEGSNFLVIRHITDENFVSSTQLQGKWILGFWDQWNPCNVYFLHPEFQICFVFLFVPWWMLRHIFVKFTNVNDKNTYGTSVFNSILGKTRCLICHLYSLRAKEDYWYVTTNTISNTQNYLRSKWIGGKKINALYSRKPVPQGPTNENMWIVLGGNIRHVHIVSFEGKNKPFPVRSNKKDYPICSLLPN